MNFKLFFSSSTEARTILAHAHGRRMLCASMCADDTWPFALVDAIAALPAGQKNEIQELLSGVPLDKPGLVVGRIKADILSSCGPGDDAFWVFQDVAKQKLWASDLYDIRPYALANPVLTADAIEALWANGATRVAKTALAANPNTPAHLLSKFIVEPDNHTNYVRCLARYGDLNNPRFRELVTGDYEFSAEDDIHRRLAARTDLPNPIILHLSHRCEQSAYLSLAKLPGFRRAVPVSTHENLNTILTKNCVRLHPDSTANTVRVVYDALENDSYYQDLVSAVQHAKAIVACHPNASRAVMEDAINDESVRFLIDGGTGIVDSPHATWAIPTICAKQLESGIVSRLYNDVHKIPDCPPELLEWALTFVKSNTSDPLQMVDAASAIMTHPNFSWEKHSFEEVCELTDSRARGPVLVAAHLAGANHIARHPRATGEHPETAVFAPNLSARQLAKLAETGDDVAVLCAMHPNGSDINVPEACPEKESVLAFRSKFQPISLRGKLAQQPGLTVSPIEIV